MDSHELDEWKRAIFQYVIDHSKVQRNGYIGVCFYFKNKNDFWRRVTARKEDNFSRYNQEEKMARAVRQQNIYGSLLKLHENHRVALRGKGWSGWWKKILAKLYHRYVQHGRNLPYRIDNSQGVVHTEIDT